MFKNYIKIAWRSLLRNKSYTTINIIGLAIGITAGLLIFLVIGFETSFDSFHDRKNEIYRVITERHAPDGIKYKQGVPFPTGPALRLAYPQLPLVASIFNGENALVTITDDRNHQIKKFKDDDVYFAEPEILKMFNVEWLEGDKKGALTEPNTVLLSQRIAEKYFGNWHNATGRIITYEKKVNLKVIGVLKNPPRNTDIPFDIAASYLTLKSTDQGPILTDWGSNMSAHNCFVVLPPNVTAANFNKFLNGFTKAQRGNEKISDYLVLQKLTDMHFDVRVGAFNGHIFSKELINTLTLIGIFLIIIACVNFINMATAQAVNRSKEVGIRKVLGSARLSLIMQFVSETFIITVFAVVLGVVLSIAVLPWLNKLLELDLTANFIQNPNVLGFLVIATISITLLSGTYPALVLSGYNPVKALKNKVTSGNKKGITLRRGLVVLQFGIAQVLVIATIIVINQLDYFKTSPLGFDKDAMLTVQLPNDSLSRHTLKSLSSRILTLPGVKDISYSFGSPSDNKNWGTTINYNDKPEEEDFKVSLKWADPEFYKIYNIKFVAGGPYNLSDTISGFVVNEAFVKSLGVKQAKDVIGKKITVWDDKSARIVGVVKDFNTTSLRDQIPPVLMASWAEQYEIANIKVQDNNLKQTLTSIQNIWNQTFPDDVYTYKFLDEKIANFYKKESQLSQLYKIFAGIAVFISCLGLYGMVSFMAMQRTKEVGIRKTLGASVSSIVYLFSKEFTLLILIAFGVAAPFAWYFMNQWLQDFTYRIHPGIGMFITAISLSLIIAWLTVGYKAFKAALTNPVKSLRSE
ncbi:ABC transporter permease [Mucilaginibacter litoreus]|uniref:ABC transporter permease n=1 Tax=Mucilaginibacter litoreus TaxID=1048221 RepID=A0ABW3AUJ6_9SPHI